MPPRVDQQVRAGVGEFDVPLAAAKQQGADLLLELLDLPRQRRLGDAQSRSRPAEMQCLRDRNEVAQATQIHG